MRPDGDGANRKACKENVGGDGMNIRVVRAEDVQAAQAIRLRSLREHPEAFGSSYEDEALLTPESLVERLRPTADRRLFGAWVDEALVGTLHFSRSTGKKIRHRAGLGAMYVAPERRGRGIGRALLTTAIAYARTLLDLEQVILAVTVGNEAARALYLTAGFTPTFVEKRYIKVDSVYYDIEWMNLHL